MQDPTLAFAELRGIVNAVMPGVVMRRRVGFRHTIGWTKPPAVTGSGDDS